MKIAIVTNAIYKPLPRYVRLADEQKRRYCDKWGLDYVRKTENPHPDLHPVWCKPSVLLSLIDRYDWLVWMDCDAMPTNFDFDLAGFLAGVGERVVMIRDINGWNNGVFSLPCTSAGRRWLEDVESHCRDARYQRGFREQQAMADSFAGEWGWLVEEPPERIGWNDYMAALYHREGDRNVWSERSWVLHLPAVGNDERANIFRGLAR